MDVWLAVREWDGLTWMETRYEDMVADLEKEGGRVTKFLGLEWHENQARYFREATAKSPSSQPITATSPNRSIQGPSGGGRFMRNTLPQYCRCWSRIAKSSVTSERGRLLYDARESKPVCSFFGHGSDICILQYQQHFSSLYP